MNVVARIQPPIRIGRGSLGGIVPNGDFKRAGGFLGLRGLIAGKGGDPAAILRQFGIDPALLDDSENYLPYSTMGHVLEHCAEMLDAPFFGFDLGRGQSLEVTGPLAILLLASPTVQEGLSLVTRYMAVHAPGARIAVVEEGETVKVTYEVLNAAAAFNRQVLELSMVVAFKTMQAIAGEDFRLSGVDIAAEAPLADSSNVARFFNAELRYGQPISALHFSAEVLDQAIDSHNPTLLKFAHSQCEALCPQETRLENMVAQQIRSLLPIGGCTLPMVAQQLSVHPRTLQNRLMAENLEFRDVLKKERQVMAETYLTATNTPLAEVAGLLGYSDQATFTRAFSSWVGMSPKKFREARNGHNRGHAMSPAPIAGL